MKKYNIKELKTYNSQSKAPVSLTEYLVLSNSDNEKYLVFKLKNNFSQVLTGVTFQLDEYDLNNELITTQVLTYDNISIDTNQEFTPFRKALVNNKCEHIAFNIIKATFNNLKWENNKWFYNKQKKKDNFSKIQGEVFAYENKYYTTKKKTLKLRPRFVISLILFIVFIALVFINVNSSFKKIYESPIEENYEYRVTGDNNIILEKYIGYNNNVIIPLTVENKNVVGIEPRIFDGKNIKSITFNAVSITIPNNAFVNLKTLESFKCQNIESIGDNAFLNCNNLKTFESGKIGDINFNAFKNCFKLEKFKSSNINHIFTSAFANCIQLKLFSPSRVTIIDSRGFDNCPNLEYLRFNIDNATSHMFYNCPNIKLIDMPNTILCEEAFYGVHNVETIKFKDTNAETLGKILSQSNFNLANTLKEVATSMKYVSYKFFRNLSQLEKINFYAQYETFIEFGAFETCNLSNYKKTNTYEVYEDSIISIKSGLQEFDIPENIKSIMPKAFQGCKDTLKLLTHTGTNFILEKEIFQYIDVLDKLYIGKDAKISPRALINISHLSELHMPVIGRKIYDYISTFTYIDKLYIEGDGEILSSYFHDIRNIKEIIIAPTITDCKDFAFNGAKNIEKITTPAFRSINQLRIPDSVREITITKGKVDKIPSNFCVNYQNLEKLTIEEGITEVGSNVIASCNKMRSIIIPNSVKRVETPLIGRDCTSLKNVCVPFIGYTKEVPVDYSKLNSSYLFTKNLYITDRTTITKTMFRDELPNLETIKFFKFMTGDLEGSFVGLKNLKCLHLYGASINHIGELFHDKGEQNIEAYVPKSLSTVIFDNFYDSPSINSCRHINNVFFLDCDNISSKVINDATGLKNIYFESNDKSRWVFDQLNKNDYDNCINLIFKESQYHVSNNNYKVIDEIDYNKFFYTISYNEKDYYLKSMVINNVEEIAQLLDLGNKRFYVENKYQIISYPYLNLDNNLLTVKVY